MKSTTANVFHKNSRKSQKLVLKKLGLLYIYLITQPKQNKSIFFTGYQCITQLVAKCSTGFVGMWRGSSRTANYLRP